MPWKETSVMEERLSFVARLLEGEGMSDVCREFGISRKTGYKIFNRYKDDGLEALTDRSRRPVRSANQLPEPVEAMIISCKKNKPHWGARKIRELLVRRLAGDVRVPSKSTVHAVLDRHGLVAHARRRHRFWAEGAALSQALLPNDLWCADFKGEFKLGDSRYCYPLTVTDQMSRYLLACEAFESTKEVGVFEAFRRLFAEQGLPSAIRSDNGLPFASPNGLYNLSKLSIWWLRLGIGLERIRPGHPQENGRHERMHLTLKRRRRAHPAEISCSSRPASMCSSRCACGRDQGTTGRFVPLSLVSQIRLTRRSLITAARPVAPIKGTIRTGSSFETARPNTAMFVCPLSRDG
ncbi:transposase InsO family protein [Rhizobium sp. BK196]|nr:transposase InsO family protein [Rhizobium sp. BK196]